ncbi:MAG: hypothetical protein D4R88_06915 [Methanosarcinales archaeon]|nr:MAG: hypothetical protein D4R88_06915 [Methanosarcinales archaeon]
MKKMRLVLGVLTILVLLAGVASAGCEDDCDGPFQTCLNLCRQTTKEDSPEAGKCADHCLVGVSGCVKKCEAKNKKDDFDQPCYVGGKHAGNCSRNKPYYNAFSGECYATLQDCKKADGDLESVPGSGGCVRCGK